ncbi:CRISPR-associated endonuclease Cas1 [Saccharothrix deserti]|uniref:CRISPR-associated endonuclease Cas1 n=1 Tax=Saccharothrix deserti TaxID=2593674 RepID=UPI00131CBB33|nr:CRISPR-associated endonuclease Cas1 [Saccharothrix deserti]
MKNYLEARLALAKTFVAGKLHNCRQLLLRAVRDTTGACRTRLRDIVENHAHALTQLADATCGVPEVGHMV